MRTIVISIVFTLTKYYFCSYITENTLIDLNRAYRRAILIFSATALCVGRILPFQYLPGVFNSLEGIDLQFRARFSLLVETSYAACDTEIESPLIPWGLFAEGFLISGKRAKRAMRRE